MFARPTSYLWYSAVLTTWVSLSAIVCAADTRPVLLAEYGELSTKFAEEFPEWRPKPPATGSLLFIAPDEYSPAIVGDKIAQSVRNSYAESLFRLAKRAAEIGQLSLAFQWATETLRENPNHADARRVLGYEKRNGKWLTPYGIRMAEAGKTWHPKFGWLAPADVTRYEAGERLNGNRWVTAEADAERHRDMKGGWQVRTDHFLVTTNHSLEAAVELAARLEHLHQIWRQLFAGFYLKENEVRRLFAGEREPRKQVRPFRVYYHRDREQYNNALRRFQPRIADTLGIYFDTTREAHFFAGDEQDPGTLHHEAVHQLFQETKPTGKRVGAVSNFWVIEGIATYFETLREHESPEAGLYFTIGDWAEGRLPSARQRLQEGFYVPLAELTQLGKLETQRRPDLSKLYSQFAGVAAFLMDGNNGRFREVMVKYLDAVYSGRDNARSLQAAVGDDGSVLDEDYHAYVESLP